MRSDFFEIEKCRVGLSVSVREWVAQATDGVGVVETPEPELCARVASVQRRYSEHSTEI